MQILSLAILGLITGVAAKLLMPGRDSGGFFITILLGIAGSLVGGFATQVLEITDGGFTNFGLGVIGAMLLLGLYRLLWADDSF